MIVLVVVDVVYTINCSVLVGIVLCWLQGGRRDWCWGGRGIIENSVGVIMMGNLVWESAAVSVLGGAAVSLLGGCSCECAAVSVRLCERGEGDLCCVCVIANSKVVGAVCVCVITHDHELERAVVNVVLADAECRVSNVECRVKARSVPGSTVSRAQHLLRRFCCSWSGGIVWCGRCSGRGWLAGADMGADLGEFIGHPAEHGVVGPVGRTGLLARGPRLRVRSNKASTYARDRIVLWFIDVGP